MVFYSLIVVLFFCDHSIAQLPNNSLIYYQKF